MAKLGKPIKSTRPLRENYRRVTLLHKGGSFEYKFEPPLWTGKDIREAQKILRLAYRFHKRALATNKEVMDDGETR